MVNLVDLWFSNYGLRLVSISFEKSNLMLLIPLVSQSSIINIFEFIVH